jgi:8-oxo-dGTP pyrophosphatase MutT (NUDIX family)
MDRHFTVTGFVVENDGVLLHWHRKLGLWLPPGGHIDADEDPVQAVLREVREETGITGEIVPAAAPFVFRNVAQLPPPISIIVADVRDDARGLHQHIDLSYVVREVAGEPRVPPEEDHDFTLVTAETLRRGAPLARPDGGGAPITDDVVEVGLAAIDIASRAVAPGVG